MQKNFEAELAKFQKCQTGNTPTLTGTSKSNSLIV